MTATFKGKASQVRGESGLFEVFIWVRPLIREGNLMHSGSRFLRPVYTANARKHLSKQLMVLVCGLAICLSSSHADPIEASKNPSSQTSVAEVLADTESDPDLFKWVFEAKAHMAKTHLDRRMNTFLKSPELRRFRAAAKVLMREINLDSRVYQLGYSALALDPVPGECEGQCVRELDLFRNVARKIGFSKSAIKNTFLFVGAPADVNAFAMSGLPQEYLDFVFLSGLLDSMSKAEVIAITGHELGHVKHEHNLDNMMVDALLSFAGHPQTKDPESKNMQNLLEILRETIEQKDVNTILKGLFDLNYDKTTGE